MQVANTMGEKNENHTNALNGWKMINGLSEIYLFLKSSNFIGGVLDML